MGTLAAAARTADLYVERAWSGPVLALRWLIDGNHTRAGARLAQVAFAAGVGAGAVYTSEDPFAYLALTSLWLLPWIAVTQSDLALIERHGPDRLVEAHIGIVALRVLLAFNLVFGLVLVATGGSDFPAWTFGFDVTTLAGSYLMYLPESPFGRRSFVAELRGRYANRHRVAAGMA